MILMTFSFSLGLPLRLTTVALRATHRARVMLWSTTGPLVYEQSYRSGSGVVGAGTAGGNNQCAFRVRRADESARFVALDHIGYCYLGDARNNTANSLLVTGALLGMDVRIAAPKDLWPSPEVQAMASNLAAGSGARVHIGDDVADGVEGADFVYTDVWVSMGEPVSEWGDRIEQLLPYQVNAATMKATGNPGVKFMHCLPALHNTDTELGQSSPPNTTLTPWKSPKKSSSRLPPSFSTKPRTGCTR
jgi:hypothetical protein